MAVVFAGNKDFFNWSVYLFPVFRLGDFVAGCIGARFWELYGSRLSQLSGKFIYMGWLLAFALVFCQSLPDMLESFTLSPAPA